MAALAESVGVEWLPLAGLRMPVTIQLSELMSDDELIAFSRRDPPYRVELNTNGELDILSPLGFDGGQRELFVMRMLGNWAEQHGGVCVSFDTGFSSPTMRSAAQTLPGSPRLVSTS